MQLQETWPRAAQMGSCLRGSVSWEFHQEVWVGTASTRKSFRTRGKRRWRQRERHSGLGTGSKLAIRLGPRRELQLWNSCFLELLALWCILQPRLLLLALWRMENLPKESQSLQSLQDIVSKDRTNERRKGSAWGIQGAW